jgi:hypothetical protein
MRHAQIKDGIVLNLVELPEGATTWEGLDVVPISDLLDHPVQGGDTYLGAGKFSPATDGRAAHLVALDAHAQTLAR